MGFDNSIAFKEREKKCLCVHVSSYWERSCEKFAQAIPIPLSAAAHTKGKGSEGEMKLTLKGEMGGGRWEG